MMERQETAPRSMLGSRFEFEERDSDTESLHDLSRRGYRSRPEGGGGGALDPESGGRTREVNVETLDDNKGGGEAVGPSVARNFTSTVEAEQPKKSTPSPPPDGGLEAWLQVAGSFFCWFNSW